MTSNAQLAALLSDSYREIEDLKRRTCPARDELRACLNALDEIRGRLVKLLGEDSRAHEHHNHIHNHAPPSLSLKRAVSPVAVSRRPSTLTLRQRTNTADSNETPSEASPPLAKIQKTMITIPRSVTAPAPVPAPVPGKVYPPTNELGQRICRTCGQPGRYKEGKCVEKWGPGPLGPGTVCDRSVHIHIAPQPHPSIRADHRRAQV